MKKKKGWIKNGKRLMIMFALCVTLLFGRETVYGLEMETADVNVEVPVFFVLIEGEEEEFLTSAFYVKDTMGTGGTYLVTSMYVGAFADAGYKLTVVGENFWEEVTSAKIDEGSGLTYLKTDNLENVFPFNSESSMVESKGVVAYLLPSENEFELQAGSLDLSGCNKSNGIYYTGVFIESNEELLLLGAPYLNGDTVGVMGMVSMTTDKELVIYDLTQLEYREELAIVAGEVESQPEEPDTQKPIESQQQEGEENPSDAEEEPPVEEEQQNAAQPQDYGWLIVVVVLVAMAALYTKSNQKKKPEQSSAASEETVYPEGTIMLSSEEQKEIDAALSSQKDMYGKEEPNMYWQIRGISGVFAGQIFVLEDRLDLGRNMYCKVIFPQSTKGISNKHCYLKIDNNVVVICDDNSSYGTYLGRGIRLEAGIGYQLNDGDVFYLASQEQSFRLECIRNFVS